MNLLKETIEVLKENNRNPEDVKWVGTKEKYMTWEEFEKISDFEYDNGYGGAEVNEYLLIVGNGFWLERHEYDGSEWWEYKEQPRKPKSHELVELDNSQRWR